MRGYQLRGFELSKIGRYIGRQAFKMHGERRRFAPMEDIEVMTCK